MMHSYAGHASSRFNDNLHRQLKQLTADVRQELGNNLIALILGGGYGRGEGATVWRKGQEHPYNDLDLTLVVAAKRRSLPAKLVGIQRRYQQIIGIEIDFSRPLTVRDIRRWPQWLMWYDLVNGHLVLTGPEDILTANSPASLRQPLPAIEATRLLLNRGSGLLWALRIVHEIESPPDQDFVRRNYFKCLLASGDALLITHGQFTTRYHGRDVALAQVLAKRSDLPGQLATLYQQALQFKFTPDQLPDQAPDPAMINQAAQLWGQIFLHVENHRTGQNWNCIAEYSRWRGIREAAQHTVAKLPRNLAVNLRIVKWAWRYPRELMYRQLPILLGLTPTASQRWSEDSRYFLQLWQRFN